MTQIGCIPVINVPIIHDEATGKIYLGSGDMACDSGLDILRSTVQLSPDDLQTLAASLSSQVDGGTF
jgi:hypothetical protein